MESLTEILTQYGTNGFVYIGLFLLIIWVVKKYDNNEERLYRIIDTLTSKFEVLEKTTSDLSNSNSKILTRLDEIKNELKGRD